METKNETIRTIQGRLKVLNKALVGEENSVQYYETLFNKAPGDTEENMGAMRMFQELREQEKGHVKTMRALIDQWGRKLQE